jgi:hypothetical protein
MPSAEARTDSGASGRFPRDRLRAVDWTATEMLDAVRTTLSAWRWSSHLRFESAELVDDMMLVAVVHHRPGGSERLGVYYSLADLSEGPNTGIPCSTREDWAVEVGMDLEEFVVYKTNERLPGPDGLVIVRWWSGGSIARP